MDLDDTEEGSVSDKGEKEEVLTEASEDGDSKANDKDISKHEADVKPKTCDNRNNPQLDVDDDSNEVDMKSASESVEVEDGSDDTIDLRAPDVPPALTDSDTEEQFSDALEVEDLQSEGSAVFKRRKLSNSRVYRSSNNNQDEEDGEAGVSGVAQVVPEPSSDGDNEIPELESTLELEDSSDEEEGETEDVDITALARDICSKTPSPPRHSLLRDLHLAQLGRQLRPSLRSRLCGSLDLVSRLHMVSKLSGHEGCVNSVSFNRSGDWIASGSDDLHIIVHDWQRQRSVLKFNTGHRANVFQSKILPGDLLVTSCSRDGQVRLAELSVTGALRSTRKLAQHKGPAHKMSLIPESPHCVLSAGEDGQVFMMDIREQKPDKILLLKNEKSKKIPIYSIHSNPSNGNLFCTSGRDQYIRVFDRRFLSREETGGSQIVKHCPARLRDTDQLKAYITCAVFSETGEEVIGSYNDEDIYLFNTGDPEGAEARRQYQGHRNSATVKGVNFYGPGSEFVISGSDCGNIFIWDKESEAIVKLMHGDEAGVVNVLEPHPSLPVLATSGLDDEVKLWMSVQSMGEDEVWREKEREEVIRTVMRNLSERERQRTSEPDAFDGQMLWVLWRHIRRADRRRRLAQGSEARGEDTASDEDVSDEDDDSDEEDDAAQGRGCTQS